MVSLVGNLSIVCQIPATAARALSLLIAKTQATEELTLNPFRMEGSPLDLHLFVTQS